MTSNRKTVAGIAGAVLCCCIAIFAFFVTYVLRHRDEPPEAAPQWFGYVCGITAIVGMISIAVLVTSLVFGLFRREDKNVGDHFIG
jgi:CDP-diglyceride synthetase